MLSCSTISPIRLPRHYSRESALSTTAHGFQTHCVNDMIRRLRGRYPIETKNVSTGACLLGNTALTLELCETEMVSHRSAQRCNCCIRQGVYHPAGRAIALCRSSSTPTAFPEIIHWARKHIYQFYTIHSHHYILKQSISRRHLVA